MRLIGRNDAFLLGGLAVALFIIVSRPIARVLEFTREIEQTSGLQLTPALIILAAVFAFHQMRKRHEMRTEAVTAAAEARAAKGRAAEMEQLVAFGQALARSLDGESIREAVLAYLPLLAPRHASWAMLRAAGQWHPLAQVGDVPDQTERERMADLAIESSVPERAGGGDICFPMNVMGTPVGVLGIAPDPPIDDDQRRALAAAAALLAVSIKNAELFREVHEHSVRDMLTGCFNRRHTLEVLDAELRRARRSHLPLSVIMFDLDHFKDINDRHGHLCGDAVLTAVGHRMRDVLRGSDVKCRYGGEEFLILLPDTPLAGAQHVADNLRQEFEREPVTWNGASVRVTASFGVTAIAPGEASPDAIIGRADAALYQAKQGGRNTVRTATLEASSLGRRASELS